jgi:quercetin dioxygenase-like cupin family protein
MTRPPAVPTVQLDNDRVTVTEWRFAPGAATGWHRHGLDYVVVPMMTGRLLLEEPGGTSRHAELTTGASYYRDAGVEHDVVNDNAFEFVFVEIEIKAGAKSR